MIVLLTKYYWGDQTKNNEMSRACGMYRRQERYIKGIGGKEPFRIPRHRLGDNNKMDLRNGMGRHGLDLSGSG
jgi:hypothetical protein